MIEFDAWMWDARPLITFLIVLNILSQTLAAILSYYRHPRNRGWFCENTLEYGVLAHVLLCAFLPAQVLYGYDAALLPPAVYSGLQIAVFFVLAFFAVAVAVLTKKAWPLLVAMVAFLALPLPGVLTGEVFPYLFIFQMLFFLARSIRICMLRYRELRSGISALSIKAAIDSLHTGVLFGEKTGHILLSNAQMQRLMSVTTGTVHRNGNHFYELLQSGNVKPGCVKRELEKQLVYLLPDGSAWMFTMTDLSIKRKGYFQLTAIGVTERWKLTEQLHRQEERLRQRGDEIEGTIANLHMLSHEIEAQKAKMRAHDILGERLTLILRAIQSEQALDHDLLGSLSAGLIDELKTAHRAPSAQDELDSLGQVFGAIGVEIEMAGELPADSDKARLFAGIAGEAVTNAVKHGFATKVYIEMNCSSGSDRLKISDNGFSLSGDINEGGGLGGMRRRIEPFKGALRVQSRPQFTLTIDLPWEHEYVDESNEKE